MEEIKKITDGEMADVVVDFTGAPPAQLNAINSAGKMGRVVFVGISHKGLNLGDKEVDNIMRGQISLIGSWNSFTDPFPGYDWTESLKLFDDAPAIFQKIKEGGFFFNKILFLPHGENFDK